MNIKYIILALSLAIPLQVCAQKKGQDEKKKDKTEKVKDKKGKNNKKNQKDNTPQKTTDATPSLIVDTIKQPTAPTTNSAQIGIVRDSLAEAKRRLDAAYAERNDLRGQTDSLKALINSLDPIIYKECILYPLSIRYNQQRINESLRAIRSYHKAVGDNHLSADFKECIKIYLPFMEGTDPTYKTYKQYSDELVAFLQKVENKLSRSQSEIMKKEMKAQCVLEVQKLSYYRLYQKKDDYPYQSIPFLDNALDTFKQLLNMPETKAKDVQKLRESITPKQ